MYKRIFRFLVEILGLDKGPPYRIVYIIAGIVTVIGFFLSIDIYAPIKIVLIIVILLVSLAFLWVALTMMFPLERRVRILVRSYAEDDDIFIFLNNEIKKWLEAISNFNNEVISDINKCETPDNKKDKYSSEQLEKIELELSSKGRFLETLVSETSLFLEVNKESIEHLIGLKIGVNKYIAKNIIYNCINIQNYTDIMKNPNCHDIDYYRNKRTKRINDLESINRTLDEQIKWNCQLGKHKKDIKKLIKLIKEESTGKAINLLVELLKTATQSDQLKFFIKAADARAGYKLGELLGFKLKQDSFVWFDMPVQEEVFLFAWEEIPGNSNEKLKKLLRESFGTNWVNTAIIDKIDNSKAIKVFTGNNFLYLRLNNEKTKVNLQIDDGGTDEFDAKIENGNLNIYDNFNQIKRFLKEFEKLRDESIEELIKNFEKSINNEPLFCFDKILGEHRNRFIDFLITNYDCRWIRGVRIDSNYLFCWDEIPGNDNEKIIEYIRQNFRVDWLRTPKIEKICDGNTILISAEKNFISLTLDDKKTKLNLKIDDCRSYKFTAKIENGKLNIYDNDLIIKASRDNNSLSLKLNETKNRATLIFNNDNVANIEEFIVREENGMLNIYKKNTIKIDYHHPISIALTYGYSVVLSGVLKEILVMAKKQNRAHELHIKLIKSEGFKTQTRGGKILLRGEQQLRDELVSEDRSIEDRCNVFPIEMIKERGIESQISKIFIGIESISTSGNVVHPRGETNIINQIKNKNPNVEVYAFGETYKVQVFDEYHVDYSKLSLLDGKLIDYIITDHEVLRRPNNGWELDCCRNHWRDKLRQRGLLMQNSSL
ncbi:MAG: hypothetical protein FIB08_12280 [Candidatus Methanoperedens sp.]|nr:hypothetical protein [Candidatus Methanoperedens sp.]